MQLAPCTHWTSFKSFVWRVVLLIVVAFAGFVSSSSLAQESAAKASDLPFHIEDWFGETKGRVNIGRDLSKSTTVVLADFVDFTDRSYSYEQGTAPKNVMIIADTIQLSDVAQFDLSGTPSTNPEDRAGGQLVIFARHLICRRNGRLIFRGAPTALTAVLKPGLAPSLDYQNGRSGQFFIGAESVELSQDFQEDALQRILLHDDLLPRAVNEQLKQQTIEKMVSLVDHTYDDEGQRIALNILIKQKTVFDNELVNLVFKIRADAFARGIAEGQSELIKKYVAGDESPSVFAPPGAPQPTQSVFRTATDAPSLIQYAPDFKIALSEWAVRWLRAQSRGITEASLRSDGEEVFRDLNAVVHFPQYPIDASVEKSYLEQINTLRTLESQNFTLRVQPFAMTLPSGVATQIDTFSEGKSLNFKLGPTTLLLRETGIDGNKKIGICRYDPNNPKELEFYISADLSVDTVVAAAAKSLANKSATYGGLFSHWNLSFLGFDAIPGVILSEKSNITVTGTLLQAKLVLPLTGIGLIQWSTSGFPVRLSWQYVDDPKINGTLNNLVLKRTTRADPHVSISDGVLTNNNSLPIRIRYALGPENKVVDFGSKLEVDSGKSVTLPLPTGMDKTLITVPPEAVECIYRNVRDYAQDFEIISGDQLAEEITVRNELPTRGIRGKGPIDSIEVSLSYESGMMNSAVEPWSVELLSTPAEASVQKRWFYRALNSDRKITVKGRVHYHDGSADDLIPSTEDSSVIHIGLERINQGNP